ncbi:tetratricopeptide repeat protein [Alsobacter sp. SYSU M60028]|uniref:Tetratricopeptide repeat protein n=1 Tax=Alsobacter ponti TaxID=2962936 RepID=A0ABT1LDH7_9HYPH|nr:tetratricopeptide repeat protein [Alsobacter ponti]MCP8939514.1 tetratricopeptide repeat protein [Alsobacter ponti]
MSILDKAAGPPVSKDELVKALTAMGPTFQSLLDSDVFDARTKSIIELLGKGLSLADIFEIPADQRHRLLAKGAGMAAAGDLAGAAKIIELVTMLEPLDEKALLALGTILSLQGRYEQAVGALLRCLALDALNAEAYLRLGECLMKAGEADKAAEAFTLAGIHASGPSGEATAARAAELARLCARSATAASAN